MRSVLSRVLWAAAAGFLACATPAGAGTLEVAPTTIVLQDAGKTGVLYVYNYGSVPITIQVEPFDWQQVNGKDQLAPSQALMSSPPIAAIPPQGKQTVRLLANPGGDGSERSFRLVVSELPDATRRISHTIQVLTQFNIPVFVNAAADARASLTWQAKASDGAVQLTAKNQGALHAKLQDMKIVTSTGNALKVPDGGLAYVLAGGSRSWKVPCAPCAAGQTIRIAASDDVLETKLDQSLVLER